MVKPAEQIPVEITIDLRYAYRIVRFMGIIHRIALRLPAQIANPILTVARWWINRFSPEYFPEITEWRIND